MNFHFSQSSADGHTAGQSVGMRRINTTALVLMMLLALSASALSVMGQAVSLAKEGKAVARIVVVDQDKTLATSESLKPVWVDLSQSLGRITGGKFLVEFEAADQDGKTDATAGPVIRISLEKFLPGVVQGEPLKPGAFYIHSDGHHLDVIGHDEKAISYGVYTLLESLGCRWFYPGDVWAITPSQPTLQVNLNKRGRADYFFQRHFSVGYGLHSGRIRDEYNDWARRNRMGSLMQIQTHHSWPVDPRRISKPIPNGSLWWLTRLARWSVSLASLATPIPR